MRVIAGELGRRKLTAPKGETTRPTPDRLRESLFSILAPTLDGQHFYDLYAGSGAVGIEALSRGAARATFIENDGNALAALRQNIAALGIASRCAVIAKPVTKALPQIGGGGIVFLDPPYDKQSEYLSCLEQLGEGAQNIVLIQHDRRLVLPPRSGNLERRRELKQGDNRVSFYFFVGGVPEP